MFAMHTIHLYTQTVVTSWLDGKHVVFGEVVGVHLAAGTLVDGIYDPAAMRTVLRAGGPASYYELTPDMHFEMHRPGV